MIISPKYKFVFIANTKTGSTSIHKTLLNCVKDKNLIDESSFILGDKHLSCRKLLEQRPQYKNYFKFAFVRNPWDRVVSWYFFCKRSDYIKRNTSDISFKEFLNTKLNVWATPNQNQYEFTKCCNYIGRYENIQEDFNIICDKIKIPQQKLPHKNASNHRHYTEYYNEETREIIAKKYAKDIEYFNYEFGK
tara:strand:+ start:7690 stop:8262 length:573 start_codon:yes stop_codon:yes gene_type:complete